MNQVMKPRLIVIAGPNGSGKTSITEELLRHDWTSGCDYINPDNIANTEFGGWDSEDAFIKAAQAAEKIRDRHLKDGNSFVFETVMSTADKIGFLLRAQKAGFFIRLFFIGTDNPTINAARVAQRVMEGGHDVPIPKIISRYSKSIANCPKAIAIADRAYVYDNSIDNQAPRLLFRTADHRLMKVYGETNDWAKPIIDGIKPMASSKPKDSIESSMPSTPRPSSDTSETKEVPSQPAYVPRPR